MVVSAHQDQLGAEPEGWAADIADRTPNARASYDAEATTPLP